MRTPRAGGRMRPLPAPIVHEHDRDPLQEWLRAFPRATVRLLAAGGPNTPAALLEQIYEWTPIVVPVSGASTLEDILWSLVEAVAARAAVVWPHWYGMHVPKFAAHVSGPAVLANDERRRQVLRCLTGVTPRWLDEAIGRA